MPMLEPYIPQPSPPAGMFRIVFGHIGLAPRVLVFGNATGAAHRVA